MLFRSRLGTRTKELASGETPLLEFVLSKIDYAYHDELNFMIDGAVNALSELIKGSPIARVQEKLNRR